MVWDGRDDAGIDVASGIYVLRLVADGFEEQEELPELPAAEVPKVRRRAGRRGRAGRRRSI